jgi:hypothetical protein
MIKKTIMINNFNRVNRDERESRERRCGETGVGGAEKKVHLCP